MKVVVLAATGQVGRTVLSELISRGHQVTAVARTPDKLPNSIHTVRDDLSSAIELQRSSPEPMQWSAHSDLRRRTHVSLAT